MPCSGLTRWALEPGLLMFEMMQHKHNINRGFDPVSQIHNQTAPPQAPNPVPTTQPQAPASQPKPLPSGVAPQQPSQDVQPTSITHNHPMQHHPMQLSALTV